jgi:hypothetical protein
MTAHGLLISGLILWIIFEIGITIHLPVRKPDDRDEGNE